MHMIFLGYTKDELGRQCETWLDPDDMSDEDFSNYWHLKKEEERLLYIRRAHKPESFYQMLDDGTAKQLNEVRRQMKALIDKYR